MSKVRLRLSGALMFVANLVGYLTGFLFTVFITRRLSEEEFGVWALIGSFIIYSLMPFSFVNRWISRDAARGKKIVGSAVVLYLLLTPISMIIYFSMALGSAASINYDPWTIAFGIIILIPYIFLSLGTAIQSGYAPQNLGIARILFEILKVVIAFYLVVTLRLGLIGAFISLSIAYLVQATLLIQKSKPLFRKEVNKEWIAKWIKGTPISAVQVISNALAATDTVLIGLITGSAVIAGYWQAALVSSALVTTSSVLMTGLGPRLISGGTQKDLDKIFNFTMMIILPMLFGFIVLSKDILWILRPTYSTAWVAASILATRGAVRAIGNFGAIAVTGTDRFDQNDDLSIKDYVSSKIFFLNGLNLIVNGLYVISVGLYLSTAKKLDAVTLITSTAAVSLLFTTIIACINLKLMKELSGLRLNFKSVSTYLISSGFMAIAVYTLRMWIGPLPVRVFEVAPIMLSVIAIGGLLYISLLYPIDPKFRRFIKEIFRFIPKS